MSADANADAGWGGPLAAEDIEARTVQLQLRQYFARREANLKELGALHTVEHRVQVLQEQIDSMLHEVVACVWTEHLEDAEVQWTVPATWQDHLKKRLRTHHSRWYWALRRCGMRKERYRRFRHQFERRALFPEFAAHPKSGECVIHEILYPREEESG